MLTDPAIARIGLSPEAAVARGHTGHTYRVELAEARGPAMGLDERGFLSAYVCVRTGRVLGACAVAEDAVELAAPWRCSWRGSCRWWPSAMRCRFTGGVSPRLPRWLRACGNPPPVLAAAWGGAAGGSADLLPPLPRREPQPTKDSRVGSGDRRSAAGPCYASPSGSCGRAGGACSPPGSKSNTSRSGSDQERRARHIHRRSGGMPGIVSPSSITGPRSKR